MRLRDKLLLNRDGSVMVIMAIILTVLIGIVGFAVDSARAYSVKQRLQESLDAAALVGARNYTDQARDTQIRAYFNANWRQGYLRSDTPIVSITTDDRTQEVLITATVNMPTIFMKLVGAAEEVHIGALTRTVRGENFLEVAIALDNTHSMALDVNGQPGTAPNRRIDLMKEAATQFVRSLYTTGAGLQNTVPNMWLSVVPFSMVVNVGRQNQSAILAPASLDYTNMPSSYMWNFAFDSYANSNNNNSWRGCVFERSFYNGSNSYGGRDMTDDPPSVEPFYPYNVTGPRYETYTVCGCPGYNYISQPAPPGQPAPPPLCYRDGVPCSLKKTLKPDSKIIPISFSADARPAKDPKNPLLHKTGATCTDGQTPLWNWWRGNTIAGGASLTNYTNAYSIETPYGVFDTPTNGSTTTSSYGQLSPYNLNTVANVCGASAVGVNTTDGSAWAPSYLALYQMYDLTARGRRVPPFPTNTSELMGGWGNSGCGMPVVPLTPNRTTIENTISRMNVPPSYTPGVGQNWGYAGTLINQGLVWAWRTLSPNWRGVWRDSSSTPIDSTLPRDYETESNHNTKTVVVLTDGLNFMPDPRVGAFRDQTIYTNTGAPGYWTGNYAGCAGGYDTNGTYHNAWECFFQPARNYHNVEADVDSSAYGILFDNGNSSRRVQACQNRRNFGYRYWYGPAQQLDCRYYECMLKDASGNCLRSASDTGNPTTGPYYDELERRMLQTCTNMKAQRVRIFFIIFAVNNNPMKTRAMAAFNDCVGAEGAVYDAADANGLQQAFADITARVRKLQILQ